MASDAQLRAAGTFTESSLFLSAVAVIGSESHQQLLSYG